MTSDFVLEGLSTVCEQVQQANVIHKYLANLGYGFHALLKRSLFDLFWYYYWTNETH